jgi:hypothetical protein
MSLGSTTAKNNDLGGTYGDNKGATQPSTLTGHLYVGDPTTTGVEFSGNGYSSPSVANTSANVGTPSGGQLASAVDLDFGTSTAAWSASGSAVPTHFAWKDGSGNLLDVLAVGSNPGITAAGQDVKISAGNLIITSA